jgi:uncharacterized protein (DUF111 family)
MTVDRIGYGAGQKDFPQANILRLFVGKAASPAGQHALSKSTRAPQTESIVVLETNLDNATGETIGHAVDKLWSAGALDVSLTPIQMKKGRPGVLLSVQARPVDVGELESILFSATPTLGVRRTSVLRTALAREEETVETPWGSVIGKVAHVPDGTQRFTPEYEACHSIATDHGVPLAEVVAAAQAAWHALRPGHDGRAI